MQFIEFIRKDGSKICVNADEILAVVPEKSGGCTIRYVSGGQQELKNDYESVVKRLQQ